MNPSMRIVPAPPCESASLEKKATSLGLHDTLQYGPHGLAAEAKLGSPLEKRLTFWDSTQETLELTIKRGTYGLHAVVRLLHERSIVTKNPHMPALPQSRLHLDILTGKDENLQPRDLFMGMEHGPSFSIHSEMERKLNI